MIEAAVRNWETRKGEVEAAIRANKPESYKDLVQTVIKAIQEEDADWDAFDPDPERIHEIDDGDYQGTLLYVIAKKGYQPSEYYFVKVGYGSCSGCDTLQAIAGYSDESVSDDQVKQYMTLALHIVQGLKPMNGEAA